MCRNGPLPDASVSLPFVLRSKKSERSVVDRVGCTESFRWDSNEASRTLERLLRCVDGSAVSFMLLVVHQVLSLPEWFPC